MEYLNQNAAGTGEAGKVNAGLGPKTPAISTDRQGRLPHAISRIDVDSPKTKAGKRKKNNAPSPAVPDDVIRKVRRGAIVAMLLAAGISARTLFQLGQIIGLPWQFAWMLPGAFDVYAYTSATVAASVPAAHPARAWAVWNARIALSFTMIGNSLVHALFLMSHGQKWTGTDYALTAVSAIPPIIVERLLHLQTKIAADPATTVAAPATPAPATPRTPLPATATPVAETASATAKPQPAATRSTPAPAVKAVADNGGEGTVATLIPKSEQLRIVRELVEGQGPEVPLAEIITRLGCHKSTASRLRSAVNDENGTAPLAGDEPAKGVI